MDLWSGDRMNFGITYDIGMRPYLSTTSVEEAISFVDLAERDHSGNVWVTSRRGKALIAGNYYKDPERAKTMLRSGFYDGI